MKKLKYLLSILTITAFLITGCSTNQVDSSKSSNISTVEAATSTEADTSSTSSVIVDTDFSARDLEVGYEESTATYVTLKETTAEVTGKGATYEDGILTISNEGSYVITGTLEEGQILVEADDSDKVQLVLNGVSLTNPDNAAIYVKSADKVFITLADGTTNTLTDKTAYEQTDDYNVDGVIFSKADLSLNGEGSLTISANYKHGIVSKDDLIITGGTYQITAVKDALNGKDCVKIKDGIIKLSSDEGNGIQSKNGDDETKGYVYIAGGDITVTNSQEGIEGTVILIEEGTINITAQDDGMNAAQGSSNSTENSNANNFNTDNGLEIKNTTDGTMEAPVNSSGTVEGSTDATSGATVNEDGSDREKIRPNGQGNFNGGGGDFFVNANCLISIIGGNITINAKGDGIDSNGNLSISGGTVYVSGPTDNGNGALDYNGSANITGGTIIAAGSTGMVQGFSDSSTQYSFIYNFEAVSEGGTEVTLTDKSGNLITSFTPKKAYQSVVISSPELEKDATYTITSGSQTGDLTLTAITTSGGEQVTGGFGGQGGFGGERGPGGGDRNEGMERLDREADFNPQPQDDSNNNE